MDFMVISLALFCISIYLINAHFFNYWKQRRIPQITPTFFMGNLMEFLSISIGESFAKFYEKFKSQKFIGLYFCYRPVLLVNDPELIQHIMIKDFTSFHDRPMPINEEEDKISGNLFFLTGQKWRDLRVKLTPLFTSGKLKMMFPVIHDSGSGLVEHMEKRIKQNDNVFEIRDLFARFTTNIISSGD
jgi:cytochrome P450 family 6